MLVDLCATGAVQCSTSVDGGLESSWLRMNANVASATATRMSASLTRKLKPNAALLAPTVAEKAAEFA